MGGVLRRFQHPFSHITTVAAYCMRSDIALGYQVSLTRMHHAADTMYKDTAPPSPDVIVLILSV